MPDARTRHSARFRAYTHELNLELDTSVSGFNIMFVVSQPSPVLAQAAAGQKAAGTAEWKTVEDVFGFPGAVLPGGVIRFDMPRTDLHVTIDGTEVKPGANWRERL